MSQTDTPAQFIEPTSAGRLKLALLGVASIGVWIAMKLWWSPFMAYLTSLPTCESLPWFRGLVLVFVAASWFAGLSAVRAARLILKSGQSPWPGALVWFRTPVRTGWRARLDACMAVLIAVLFLAGPVVAAVLVQVHVLFCIPASCGC